MATTPAAAAAKWATNLGTAASNGTVQSGIQAVTTAPGQAAAAQKAAWVQNTPAAANKWASRTAAVSLSSWQNDAINKGLPRIATGATAAQPKFQAFMTQLLPAISNVVSTLPPRGNFSQNVARMNAFVTGMHNFSYTPTGS